MPVNIVCDGCGKELRPHCGDAVPIPGSVPLE